jgi:ABC-type transport system involved in multi-copper enzyme maturation permease subunit
MTLWEIFRFELDYQWRRHTTWLYSALLLLVTFYLAAEVSTDYARSTGTSSNDPYFVAAITVFGSLAGVLIAAALAGDAAARDVETRMHPLVDTTPVRRLPYLAGRWLAALSLYTTTLLVVPVASVLVSLLTNRELAGSFRPAAYLDACLFLLLPNAFVATTLLFAMAALTRRAVVSYLGALLFMALTMFSLMFVALTLQRVELAKLIDPSGGVVIAEIGRLWTPAEKGTRFIELGGSLLANRVLWVGIALGALALTYFRMRSAYDVNRSWFSAPQRTDDEPPVRREPVRVPRRDQSGFGVDVHFSQAFAIARESFKTVVMSWGSILVAAVPALFVVNGIQDAHMGVPFVPTTERLTGLMGHSALVWILIAFSAGELVWREREARVSDMTDATPVPEWVWFLGKFTGLGLVLVLVQALVMTACIGIQAFRGHTAFEIDVYGKTLLGLQLLDYVLIAVLALVVHVLVNHKYAAHLLVAIAVMLVPARGVLGLEHNLLVYRGTPGWSYSDLRGFETSIGPWFWFSLYWAAWTLFLAVTATVFWVRGTEPHPRRRLGLARRRFTPRVSAWVATALALILTVGGFIFYNTNVLNAYRTASDITSRRAEYERRYGLDRTVPQPQVAGVNLDVEIFTGRRRVEIRGTFDLINRTGGSIDRILIAPSFDANTLSIEFDRPATAVLIDDALGHRVYALERALRPSESLRLQFVVRREPRGFENDGIDASVVANGTYFRIEQWLPAIGYQPEREVRTAVERRALGLPERTMAGLYEVEARDDAAGPARATFEAVVGTEDGQLAVAPGSLRRTWTRDGRRYFHYVADAPISEDYAFFSADYAVRRAQWQDVSIEVVHHPGHTWNVDRMVQSAQASLEYFTERFGRPYPHRVLRLVERPGDAVVLHASPINTSYEESFALLNPRADPRSIDLPFAVVAHEVAHQWWGHMVTPARVEGGALLSESLAWYSALALVENTLGTDHVQRVLQMMREAYLLPQPRGNVPLLRADDWFLAYRKGPFAMWALREYVGADRIDAVLRRMIDRYGSDGAPLPTSLDLYRELQAATPESLQYLLVDLFEANTYWDLETQKVAASQLTTGAWQVTLDVFARKRVVDEDGVETDVPMNDLIEVGVFVGQDTHAQPVRMHRLRSGHQRITVTVPERPARAGVDPRGLLIDLDAPNNVQDLPRDDGLAFGR